MEAANAYHKGGQSGLGIGKTGVAPQWISGEFGMMMRCLQLANAMSAGTGKQDSEKSLAIAHQVVASVLNGEAYTLKRWLTPRKLRI